MNRVCSTKYWVGLLSLLILVALAPGIAKAQSGDGTITVEVCTDQNANGLCDDPDDGPAPPEVEVCLNDQSNCQPAPATFDNLLPGSYTPFLRFAGASQGHYPTTPRTVIDLAEGAAEQLTLGALYPIHPKGIAIHAGLNKVYAAFIGPVVDGEEPYPFVAVIDGQTDEVLRTIPGGPDGIGRQPWGVAVSGDNVYVGSFGEGRVSVIDANSDAVIANLSPPGNDFQPTAPAVNPINGWVHFPDYRGGRVVIIAGTTILQALPVDLPPQSFSPFEIAVADVGAQGYSFVTMRDALQPDPYRFATLDNDSFDVSHPEFSLPDGGSGPLYAIGLWQQPGQAEPRLFTTYADDPRSVGESFPNPNKLAVYSFDPGNPQALLPLHSQVELGDYAEAGLIFDPIESRMIGSIAGFAYDNSDGHVAACASSERGGLYLLDFDGNASPGPLPTKVVGNPPLIAPDLLWRNPFELALNPANGKIYVTDRCWNEFPGGGQPGGGAVLTFDGSFTPEPEVTVSKSDSPDPVRAGDPLQYTVRVENTGTVDLRATITDILPPGVTPNAPLVWDNIFIPVGGVWEESFVVTVDPETRGILTNRVEVTTEEGATASAIEETMVLSESVTVTKSDSPDPVPAGEVLSYTIRVENNGSLDLHANVVDILPPEVTPNGPTSWADLLIPAGETLELLLNVTVDPTAHGPLVNRVEVTTAEGPGDTAEETTQVANLTVTKIDTPDPVLAGEVLNYTIRVDNTGSVDLHANIVDLLPPNVTPAGPTSWNDIFIPVGGFWEQALAVTVDPLATDPLTNRVEVTTQEGATGETETVTEVIPRGIIIVSACPDQDADGNCSPGDPLPPGVQGCLRGDISGDLGCQPVSAVFTGLDPADTFTPFLQFTAESEGHYPTTRPDPLQVAHGEEVEVILGAVYPVHPKGLAVHQALNKVYVAFQGPTLDNEAPYPFVAVIDGDSDEVLYTIPGGPTGIGRSPWGVAVSGDGSFVYVSSFGEQRISVIDPAGDTVVDNLSPGGSFRPTVAVLNPNTGWVHFPNYQGGRMIAVDGLTIVRDVNVQIPPMSFSPFEMVVADHGAAGYSFITMRDALLPHRYKFATLNNTSLELTHADLAFSGDTTGPPHAISLWQEAGMTEPRLFMTYADDPRPTGEPFPNPNKLVIYSFPAANPKDVVLRQANIAVGDYAEAGLIFDPTASQMVGTFAGFPYSSADGDVAACDNPERGGTYTVDFEGNVSPGFGPDTVVGNPPLTSASLDWKNPFELAANPDTNKLYVTDRCWSDFPVGGQAGGGAVLIYARQQDAISSPVPAQSASSPGDVNGDGQVDMLDLSFVTSRYGTDDSAADLNGDGLVDLLDVLIVVNNYGQ